MTPKLSNKLINKYPKIMKWGTKENPWDATRMGIACGDGWYPLIDHLCFHIQKYLDRSKTKEVEQVRAAQIKEKFGMLNFYYDGGDNYTKGLVSMAESFSTKICETCGNRAMEKASRGISGTGWIKALCEGCHIARVNNLK